MSAGGSVEAASLISPRVPLQVPGAGYDFAQVKPRLVGFQKVLPAEDVRLITEHMRARGEPPQKLGLWLVRAIPQIISVAIPIDGTDNEVRAATMDFADRLARMRCHKAAGAVQTSLTNSSENLLKQAEGSPRRGLKGRVKSATGLKRASSRSKSPDPARQGDALSAAGAGGSSNLSPALASGASLSEVKISSAPSGASDATPGADAVRACPC